MSRRDGSRVKPPAPIQKPLGTRGSRGRRDREGERGSGERSGKSQKRGERKEEERRREDVSEIASTCMKERQDSMVQGRVVYDSESNHESTQESVIFL